MKKFIFFWGTIILFTSSLKSVEITEDQATLIRTHIYKELSFRRKSLYINLFDENGKQTVAVLIGLIKWAHPVIKELFKNPTIKKILLCSCLTGTQLPKQLVTKLKDFNFCDENRFLQPPIAAIIRTYFAPQENQDYLLKITHST